MEEVAQVRLNRRFDSANAQYLGGEGGWEEGQPWLVVATVQLAVALI